MTPTGLAALAAPPGPPTVRRTDLPRTVAVLDDRTATGLAPHLDLWRIEPRGVGTDVGRIDPALALISTSADGAQRAWRAHAADLRQGPAARLLGIAAERGVPAAVWDLDGTTPVPGAAPVRRFALRPGVGDAAPLQPAASPAEDGPAALRRLRGSTTLEDAPTRAALRAARDAAVLQVRTDDADAVGAALAAAAGGAAVVATAGSWIAELLDDGVALVGAPHETPAEAARLAADPVARRRLGRAAWTRVARSHLWQDRASALLGLAPAPLPSLRVVLAAEPEALDLGVAAIAAQRLDGVVGALEVVARRPRGGHHELDRLDALAARTGLVIRSEATGPSTLVASLLAHELPDPDHLAGLALLVDRLGAGPVAATAEHAGAPFARAGAIRRGTWLATSAAAGPLLRAEERGAEALEAEAFLVDGADGPRSARPEAR